MEGGDLTMSSIDQRLVEMKFNYKDFEHGIKNSLTSLDSLKQGLKLEGATKGLQDVNAASKRFSLANMNASIDTVSQKFSAMGVIAVTALATIAHKAILAGGQLAKSLTVAPIVDGLKEYETNLNSIQTILSNTSHKGTTLDQVNKALQELNEYSDKTIYNFAQMAKNIGTFTAAGVDLNVATGAIKGIANLAAVSGSNADQASTAMYQLSQALSTGSVKLMDWNSVVNAGMGGEVFQNALKDSARAHGVSVDSIIKKEGSFRDSLQTGWLSAEILTDTLSKFTGDLTASQLKQMGYTDQQIVGILKMGKTAQDAATKVKTVSQLLGTLKEASGSGWSQTWQLIFGDFEEAKTLFTNVNNVLSGMISASADARNKILGDWKKLGGRTELIKAIANAFEALMSILKPIKAAFREIFPAKTGKDLYNLTVMLRKLTGNMVLGSETASKVKDTFAGVFAIFSIIGKVIAGVASVFGRLFGSMKEGSGGILDFTSGVGDFLVVLNKTLEQSGAIKKFFGNIGDALAVPLKLLKALAQLLGELFNRFDTQAADDVTGALDRIKDRMDPLQKAGEQLKKFFDGVGKVLSKVGKVIVNALANIGDAISNSFTGETFSKSLDVINTALLGGIVLMLKKFFSGGMSVDVGGGLFDKIKESLDGVTGLLQNMQANIKADIILKIAGALALLTASILVLSTIDSGKMAKAMVGLTVGFIGLQVALTTLSTAMTFAGAAKLPLVTASLIALSTALLLLSFAVKSFADLELGDMLRGLVGMILTLTIISKALIPLSANAAGMIRAAGALTILGVALNLIALALKLFATISWNEMAHGFVALGGSLAIIIATMRLLPKGMVAQAAALTILAVAINGIGIALKLFSTFSWDAMAHGLVAMAGALVIIAGAMHIMPKNMLIQAAALVVLSGALNSIAIALKLMGGQSWEEIAKGLVTLAGSLVILAGGLYLMTGTIAGAAALLVAAGALAILTPVLAALGSLSWQTILTGLGALAGLFVVLGLAGLVLTPIVPALLGLSAALVLLGIGLGLAGAACVLFATAFGIVVATGTAGIQVLQQVVLVFVRTIPIALKALGEGLVAFLKAIASKGPEFVKAIATIIANIIQAVIINAPKMGQAFSTVINTGLKVLVDAIPKIVDAGYKLFLGLLRGIDNNISQIIKTTSSIIVKFLDGLAKEQPKIVDSGVKFIIAFINGLTKAIDAHSKELGEAGARLGVAIIKGMAKGIAGGHGVIVDAAKDVAKGALNAAKGFLGIGSPSKEFFKIGKFMDEGMANGLTQYSRLVARSSENVGNEAINSLKLTLSSIPDVMSGNIDMRPVISPVLDLSTIKKDASQIGSMLTAPQLSVDSAYSKAQNASAGYRSNQAASEEVTAGNVPTKTVNFIQNNTSPKALSSAEIYRQTKNQLSVVKGAL
jgi:tape measure domain-containing protein